MFMQEWKSKCSKSNVVKSNVIKYTTLPVVCVMFGAAGSLTGNSDVSRVWS